ncbi:DUF4150 domain-containing protein [Archangium minus]|uniref:DUF4150 domain-containing protein n=1 Tax=Archangium minus TaxID=83450 RepID=A0ABY9WXV5_9BACT|nr:DUF4150 domain-containing protein [Archangium minus]
MTLTVGVNNLSLAHKGSGGVTTASAPDVCKTPTPGGPVPIPYPNIAFSKDLVDGSVTVKADGEPIALKDSAFSTSTGDEPGSVGGVVSGVNKGKAKFSIYSMDVKVEGRNVARLSDNMTMNGNAPNTVGPELQPLVRAVGSDVVETLCLAFCWCDKGKKGGDLFVEPYGGPTEA